MATELQESNAPEATKEEERVYYEEVDRLQALGINAAVSPFGTPWFYAFQCVSISHISINTLAIRFSSSFADLICWTKRRTDVESLSCALLACMSLVCCKLQHCQFVNSLAIRLTHLFSLFCRTSRS